MAEISFTIPTSQVPRMVDALCESGGYDGDPEDQTARREFARGVVRDLIREEVRRVEMRKAYQAMIASSPAISPLDIS